MSLGHLRISFTRCPIKTFPHISIGSSVFLLQSASILHVLAIVPSQCKHSKLHVSLRARLQMRPTHFDMPFFALFELDLLASDKSDKTWLGVRHTGLGLLRARRWVWSEGTDTLPGSSLLLPVQLEQGRLTGSLDALSAI